MCGVIDGGEEGLINYFFYVLFDFWGCVGLVGFGEGGREFCLWFYLRVNWMGLVIFYLGFWENGSGVEL